MRGQKVGEGAKESGKQKPGESEEHYLNNLPAEKDQHYSQRAEADCYKGAVRITAVFWRTGSCSYSGLYRRILGGLTWSCGDDMPPRLRLLLSTILYYSRVVLCASNLVPKGLFLRQERQERRGISTGNKAKKRRS